MGAAINLTGIRFGRLTVLYRSGKSCRGSAVWACACDCGKEKIANSSLLIQGKTRSCGCMRSEVCRAKKTNPITKTCPICKNSFLRTTKQVNAVIKRSGQWTCKACSTKKANVSRERDIGSTRIHKQSGYVLQKTECGWRQQHILVIEQHIGRRLIKNEVVHHIAELCGARRASEPTPSCAASPYDLTLCQRCGHEAPHHYAGCAEAK